MTYFIRRGDNFHFADEAALDIHTKIPVGTYTVFQDPDTMEYYLSRIEDYKCVGKTYGSVDRHVERIYRTFQDRPSGTGVLLEGIRGSGKSTLAKLISIRARSEDIPTIVINEPHHGENFNRFIQSIDQPAVILFDEFEKVYDEKRVQGGQGSLLTLLDGSYPSKKLFVLTCNDKFKVNEHMRNRPGRIYYVISFDTLETSFIEEYCNDHLIDKSQIERICNIGQMFNKFSFDMLKAIVEEVNRFGEQSVADLIRIMNIRPEFCDSGQYSVKVFEKESGVPLTRYWPKTWSGNPLAGAVRLTITDEDDEDTEYSFTMGDVLSMNNGRGNFTFARGEYRVVLERAETRYSDVDFFSTV